MLHSWFITPCVKAVFDADIDRDIEKSKEELSIELDKLIVIDVDYKFNLILNADNMSVMERLSFESVINKSNSEEWCIE